MKRIVLIALLALFIQFSAWNPICAAVHLDDFGLKEAKTGVERFWVLYNAHVDALKRNETVDYAGIKEIEIEIPGNAISIPLGRNVNFKGMVLNVKNTTKDFYLFSLINEGTEINIHQNQIDGYSFFNITELATGTKLLIVEDRTPWVNERKGYNHAVYRKDIILIKNGMPQNRAVMPYDESTVSKPACRYVNADDKQKKIQNLTFKRMTESTYKTCLVQVEGQNNVILKNIKTYTPADDKLYGDHIINLANCTNVTFKNVSIDGVYCPNDSWGYGVGLDNVFNVKFYNVRGSGTVFGSNNVNTSYLKECNLSRYDIHCYGRDARMDKCFFWGSGFRTSSFYGDLVYNKCTLKYYLPVSIRNEYSCNVPYNLVMKNCTYYISDKYNCVIYTGNTNYRTERRPELEEKCLPNVSIDGLRIIPDSDVKDANLFLVGHHDADAQFEHISDITVKNVVIEGNQDFNICSSPFDVKNEARIEFQQKGKSSIKKRTNTISVSE